MRKPNYSAFDLSHEKKLSFEMGQLIPILTEEIVPGDQFKISSEIMLRFAPMIAPVMHRVNAYIHYFFVPNRIVWDEWEDFITGGQQGTTSPTMPVIAAGSAMLTPGSLGDFLGVQGVINGGGTNQQVMQLPFRAYQLIYNEYYRDETLDTIVDITNGASIINIQKRRWEKDYYTSSLPFSQRGPETDIPISFDAGTPSRVKYVDSETGLLTTEQMGGSNVPEGFIQGETPAGGAGTKPGTSLSVDNSEALNITINDLRTSSRLQEFLEKNARGGYRYIEQLLSHFGVKSSDARLQRPEYLGGGRQPVVISEVLNTSGTATEEQGTMAGHGISVGTANRASQRFEEHGWLMGIMSVIPRTNYQQGIHRKFSRTDKLDYYFPEFAHLGEQEVLQKEIYYDTGELDLVNDGTFGYQQRYAEYKYGCSTVHGDFRDTLNFWHLGREFATAPALNTAFVRSEPSTRIFAVTSGDHMWCQIFNNIKARRPMPYFANPKL